MSKHMTRQDLLALPPSIKVDLAGELLGYSRGHAYNLAKQDKFPVPMRKVGHSYRVLTAPLLKYLGIDESDHSQDTPGSTSSGEADNSRRISSRSYRSASGKPIEEDKVYYVRSLDRMITGAEVLQLLEEAS